MKSKLFEGKRKLAMVAIFVAVFALACFGLSACASPKASNGSSGSSYTPHYNAGTYTGTGTGNGGDITCEVTFSDSVSAVTIPS